MGEFRMNTRKSIKAVGYIISQIMIYIFFIISVINWVNIIFTNLIHVDSEWAKNALSKPILLEIFSILGMCVFYALTKKFRSKENPMLRGTKFLEDGGAFSFISLSTASLIALSIFCITSFPLIGGLSLFFKGIGLWCLASVLFPKRFITITYK